MNIEVSPKEYWKRMNYYEGLFYCDMVVIDNKTDWRMIYDYVEYKNLQSYNSDITIGCIFVNEIKNHTEDFLRRGKFIIIPVRDI